MTKDEMVAEIIEVCDGGRFDTQGGYPSDWTIWHSRVILATVDHDDAPTLEITPIDEFIADHAWVFLGYPESYEPEVLDFVQSLGERYELQF